MSVFNTLIANLDLSKRIIDILSSVNIIDVSDLLNFLDKNKLQDIDGISDVDEDVILNVLRDLFDSIFVDVDEPSIKTYSGEEADKMTNKVFKQDVKDKGEISGTAASTPTT